MIEQQPLDVVVLDVGLPKMSGIELCSALRRQEIDIPILILSAHDAVGDRVTGLQAGADDYLVKPFELSELVARLAALLRRAEIRPGATTVLRLGNLRVDTERRRPHVATELLDLTRREFDLLAAFATNPGVVLSRVRLLELVWGYDFDVDTNVVDVFVGYLRPRCQQPAHSNCLQNRSLRITLLACGVQSFCLQAWVLGRRDHACGPNSSGHHRPRRRLRSPEGPGDRGRSVGSLVGGDLAAAR